MYLYLYPSSRLTGSYKKAELKSFLQFHREGEEPLRDDEVRPRFPIPLKLD
jgi:hypothetical protein